MTPIGNPNSDYSNALESKEKPTHAVSVSSKDKFSNNLNKIYKGSGLNTLAGFCVEVATSADINPDTYIIEILESSFEHRAILAGKLCVVLEKINVDVDISKVTDAVEASDLVKFIKVLNPKKMASSLPLITYTY